MGISKADVNHVLAEELGLDPAEITDGKRLTDDLYVDSLDIVEVAMGLEDEFGVELEDETVEAWVTVGDVYRSVGAE